MRFKKKKKEKHRSAVTLSDNGTLSDYVDGGGGGVDEGETKDQKENGSRRNLHGEFKCV